MAHLLKFIFVIWQILGIAGAIEFCEDRSSDIDRGRIECHETSPYGHNYRQALYQCNIKCALGYIAHPATQSSCRSSGSQVWRIDSNGNRARVWTGTWNPNIDQAHCAAPTTCLIIRSEDKPQHGNVVCTSQSQNMTCTRTCNYPYEVTEPEFQQEHCGPDTNFFWSHVLRRNSTKMPPCAVPLKCRPLQESDQPEHGQMLCRFVEWADTTICELQCERGYVPKATSKSSVFCGPTTAYIWSHVHTARDSYARIIGCEQSPLTTEVTIRLKKSCRSITREEKEQGVEELQKLIDLEMKRQNFKQNSSLISWMAYCNSSIIKAGGNMEDAPESSKDITENETGVDNTTAIRVASKCKEVKLELAAPEQLHEMSDGDTNLLVHLDEESSTSTATPTAPTSTERMDQSECQEISADTGIAFVSDLTFSLYYNITCIRSKCRDACSILNLSSQNDQCFKLCAMMARVVPNQVRYLATAHAEHLMKSMDVTTFNDVIDSAKFKSLNVTTKAPNKHSITHDEIHYVSSLRDPGTWLNYYNRPRDTC